MNTKKLLLPIVFLALGLGGFVALKKTRPEQPQIPAIEPFWRIEAMTVEPGALRPALNLTGKVESPEFTEVAAPGLGRVARVAVREGQAVRRDTLLIELDERDFQPRVAQAQGAVDELLAAIRSETLRHAADLDQLDTERKLLSMADADLARFEQLQKENFYSQAAVDQSRANVSRQQMTLRGRELAISDHQARLAQLNARLLQARANLESARLALERSRVLAPFDGFVAAVPVAPGDQVNTGQLLLSLYPAHSLEVRAKIPAPQQDTLLALLAQGARPEATARQSDGILRLQLERLAAAADTRGLDGFFRIQNSPATLRVGSLLSLNMHLPPVPGTVAVPYGALYNGRVVYRVVAGRLQGVPVNVIGELAGEAPRLLVQGGLAQGDKLMLTHLPNALSGLKVEILPGSQTASVIGTASANGVARSQ